MRGRLSLAAAMVAVLALTGTASSGEADPPEVGLAAADWPAPNHDLSSTRAAVSARIGADTAGRLRVAWRFRLTNRSGYAGRFASTPVVVGQTVYLQDLGSNVYALDRRTGRLRWTKRYGAPTGGPNGLAVGYGLVFGNTDTGTFALDAATGRQLWSRRLITRKERYVEIAPVVTDGLVFTSTIGYAPGGRGALYALDALTGAVRWRFDTIKEPWRYPNEAGGGGAWFPVSVDGEGTVYSGNSNPGPWGGTPKRPNGGSFPGPALYTDSLLVLDGTSGALRWYDQVTPHDVRDYDFQASPILARLTVGGVERDVVIGAGKAGIVLAWDRASGERLWESRVGLHRNDLGPLPKRPVTVCPGLLGGVETPMALAEGRLFVPVVDLCMQGSATGYESLSDVDPERGAGQLVALDASTGRRLWVRRFSSPLFGCATVARDLVITPLYDGRIVALSVEDGERVWQARARAGINACPAVAGDLLLVGAGVPLPSLAKPVTEVIAYRLPAGAS